MAAVGHLIRALLYPPNAGCLACGRMRVDEARWGLCRDCARRLSPLEPPFCPRCGAPGWMLACPSCAARPQDALDSVRAAFYYEGIAGALVRALKYRSIAPAADALADGMAQAQDFDGFDTLVPVPLHRRRQRQRGYNQSAVLCEALSARVGLPAEEVLCRTRATRTQTRLTQQERSRNVQGAFACALPVQGRRILLVDDVLTTGATARACAETLKEAGASVASLLAAARAGEHMEV